MKTKTEMISARLRVYGKNSTKISDNCQVQLEIRNYTDKPLRISAKDSSLKLMQLKPHQMKNGVCVGRKDGKNGQNDHLIPEQRDHPLAGAN